MSPKRCPACGQTVMVGTIRGPSAVMIYPCGHEIHRAALIDAPALNPPSPGEWVTEFLAAADDN
jgi:hypothetical protein